MMKKLNVKKLFKVLKTLIIILIILAIIAVIAYFVWNTFFAKKLTTLSVYKDINNNICGESSETCNIFAFDLIVNGKAKILDTNNYYVLYENETVNLYDIITKETRTIELPNDYDKYELAFDNYTNRLIGIYYYDKKSNINNQETYSTSGFYNLKNNRLLYQDKYNVSLKLISNEYLTATNYDSNNQVYKNDLISVSEEKVVATSTINNMINDFNIHENNAGYFIYEKLSNDQYNFYTQGGKLINEQPIDSKYYSYSDDYLYIYKDYKMQLVQYDINGNIISTKQYNVLDKIEIIAVYENYIVYYQNGQVYLYDVKNNNRTPVLSLKSKPSLESLDIIGSTLILVLYDVDSNSKIELRFNIDDKSIKTINYVDISKIENISITNYENFFLNNSLIYNVNKNYLGAIYSPNLSLEYQISYTIDQVVNKYYDVLFNGLISSTAYITKEDVLKLVNKIFNLKNTDYNNFYNSSLVAEGSISKTSCDLDKCSVSLIISSDDTHTSNSPGYAYKINENNLVDKNHVLNVSFIYIEPSIIDTLTSINLYQKKGGEFLGTYIEANNMVILDYDYLLEKIENKNTLSYTYEFDENNVLIDIR